jgi:hypothetical protein
MKGIRKAMTAPNDSTQDPSAVPATNPPPVDTPPAQPVPQHAAPQRPVIIQSNNGDVLSAVNALPEKLVDAVRELIPQSAPTPSAQQPQSQSGTQTPPATPVTADSPAKRRSVGEWFFGVNKR